MEYEDGININMNKFAYEDIPKYLVIELVQEDWIPEIGEYFVAQLNSTTYLSGRVIETRFDRSQFSRRECLNAVVQNRYIIISNIYSTPDDVANLDRVKK